MHEMETHEYGRKTTTTKIIIIINESFDVLDSIRQQFTYQIRNEHKLKEFSFFFVQFMSGIRNLDYVCVQVDWRYAHRVSNYYANKKFCFFVAINSQTRQIMSQTKISKSNKRKCIKNKFRINHQFWLEINKNSKVMNWRFEILAISCGYAITMSIIMNHKK